MWTLAGYLQFQFHNTKLQCLDFQQGIQSLYIQQLPLTGKCTMFDTTHDDVLKS